MVQTNSGAVT